MASTSLHRLVQRLHAPQVALRASKDELFLAFGSLSALMSPVVPAVGGSGTVHALPTPFQALQQPPGVLGQRASQLAWQSAQTKELRVLLHATTALGWSSASLPHLFDALSGRLLVLARAAAPFRASSEQQEAPPAGSSDAKHTAACIVSLVAMACQQPSTSATTSSGEDFTAQRQEQQQKAWTSLSIDALIRELTRIDPAAQSLPTIEEVGLVLDAYVHVLLRPPSEGMCVWIAQALQRVCASQRSTGDSVGAICDTVDVLLRYLPKTISGAPLLSIADALRMSTNALLPPTCAGEQLASETTARGSSTPPLWAATRDLEEASALRYNLRTQLHLKISTLSRSDAPEGNGSISAADLSSLLRMWVRLDIRDVAAAEEVQRIVKGWWDTTGNMSASPNASGGATRYDVLHELLYFARRSPSLQATSRFVASVLANEQGASTSSTAPGGALTQLLTPDILLNEWEHGQAPDDKALYSMLNEAHTYSMDHLATILFLFPHRPVECEELCGRILVHLNEALKEQQAMQQGGLSDATEAPRPSTISGKGLALLSRGCARANWFTAPLIRNVFMATTDLALAKLSGPNPDLSEISLLATSYLVDALPCLNHWELNAAHATECLARVDAVALAIANSTLPYLLLGTGSSLISDHLQQIGAALGCYAQQLRRSERNVQDAHSSEVRTIAARLEEWYRAACTHLIDCIACAHLCDSATGTTETGCGASKESAAFNVVLVALEWCLAWDRTHHRLMDACRNVLNASIASKWLFGTDMELPLARLLVRQHQLDAPELESATERVLRHICAWSPLADDGSDASTPTAVPQLENVTHPALVAALTLASIHLQYHTLTPALIQRGRQLEASASPVGAILQAQAIQAALTRSNGARCAPFVADLLSYAQEIALAIEPADVGGEDPVAAKNLGLQRSTSEIKVGLLLQCANRAHHHYGAGNGTDYLQSIYIASARLVPCVNARLVSEVIDLHSVVVGPSDAAALASPLSEDHKAASAALVLAVCERMSSLSWSWTPSQLAKATFGLGEAYGTGSLLAHQVALHTLSEHVVDHAECFHQGSAIARMLLGFAKAHITTRSLFHVFAQRLKQRPINAAMRLSDISCALEAFGKAKYVDKDLFDRFGRRILASSNDLSPADVTMATCAFSRTMLLHPRLYESLGSRAATIMSQLPASAATSIVSAFGHVGVGHQALGDAVCGTQDFGQLSALEATSLIVGLWQMRFIDTSGKMDALGHRVAELDGAGLGVKQLVELCSVLQDLRWRHPQLLMTVARRATALVEQDASSIPGEAARVVLDTLGVFSVHNEPARRLLAPAARSVSRDAIILTSEERELLLGTGLN